MNDVIRPSKKVSLEAACAMTALLALDDIEAGRIESAKKMLSYLVDERFGQMEEMRAEVKRRLARPSDETRAQLPAQLVDRLMQAIESLLTEEYSKVIDESWVTAPVRRTRKALNELQAIRAKRNTSIDKEWERAKDAMTGDAPKAEGGGT